MTSRSRNVGSSRRRVRGLVGLFVAVSALALPAIQQGSAVAKPHAHTHPVHPVQGAAPGSFNGDVRDLTNVPSSPLADPELTAPASSKRGSGHVGSSGPVAPNMPGTTQNFAGLDFNTWGAGWPPDTVGDVGPNNYVEAVNTSVGIYSKTGTQQAAFTFNTLWSTAGTGTSCDTANQGDPTVVYDPMADRWFVADFSWSNIQNGPYYECVAVSKSGDPVTGGWWFYAIRADDNAHPWLPDYPKMGIWPDGLYMSTNMFDCLTSNCSSANYSGVRVYAFNRTAMEAGAPLQEIVADLGTTPFSLLPSNLRGAAPPLGSLNYFVGESRTAWAFDVYKFHVDWVTPASSTFTGPTSVSQTSYGCCASVPQAGTSQLLDSLEGRLMMQAQYRNLSGTESLWVSHTVGNSAPIGIQWAQINVTGATVVTTPVQQQIWTNVGGDGVSRWMPSLAVDRLGDMAMGYSASSSTLFPSIRYAGRLAGDPLNNLGQGEATMFAGTGSQTTIARWGDYTSMSVDPVDDCTFWYVGEYLATSGSNWQTRIGSFKFPGCTAGGGSADLAITNTDAPDPVLADSPVTYTLHVTNAGSANATNVVVTDTPPANVILGAVTPTQGSCSGTTTIRCNLGGISNGGFANVTVTVTPVAPGIISNTASVAATETDPNAANNSASQSTTVKAQAKTKYVSITDSGITPSALAVAQGTTVQWNFFGPSSSSVTDNTGMGLFSSGPKAPVSYHRFTYIGAGTYGVVDALHHTGTVKVALKAAPASGTVSTPFTITWSSAVAPAGFTFDVQVLRPGSSTWSNWLTGQTAKSGVFTPDAGAGTYQFRALMRNAGGASANSAVKKITAS